MPPPPASATRPPQHPDGLPLPRRYWAMVAIALAITMSVLDSTIVNVALPTIARELHASAAASIWVVNAYQLAILVLLLPLASLGEIVGYRRISQAGLAVFTLASLGCAFAPNLLALSIARVVQGVGAAGIMSVSGALVRFTYPHRYPGRAVGITPVVATPRRWSTIARVWRSHTGAAVRYNVPLGSSPSPSRCARYRPSARSAFNSPAPHSMQAHSVCYGLQSPRITRRPPLALLQIGAGVSSVFAHASRAAARCTHRAVRSARIRCFADRTGWLAADGRPRGTAVRD
jgi:hypothetical protein